MKILESIKEENYDDFNHCLNFLKQNLEIGNEENVEYNGLFHIHWRGPINNDKVILQIKSILATQNVSKIYFWVENMLTTITSSSYPKLMQFGKYVEIKVFDKNIFNKVKGDYNNKEKIWNIYNLQHPDRRYRTDIFRWVILSIYGGIYTDADTLLLRDLRDIKLNNWSNTWGNFGKSQCAEACILKLEKNSNVYEQMYLNNPNNTQCFLLLDKLSYPSAYHRRYDNLNFTALPCAFFDIIWGNNDGNTNVDGLVFSSFEDFFKETNQEVSMNTFLKGCFAYHWHNHWDYPELKNSYAGKLNADIDRIIEEKYNIKPIKIFQK